MRLHWLTEDNWVAGPCQDVFGNTVPMRSEEAVKYDLFGAIYISFKRNEIDEIYDLVDTIKMLFRIYFPDHSKKLGKNPTLYQINDSLTFEEVQKLLRFM